MMMRRVARRVLRQGGAGEPLRLRPPASVLEVARDGALPLRSDRPDPDGPLHVAAVIPAFRHGSGGHSTLTHLLRGLEARGHTTSVWVQDDEGRHAGQAADELDALYKRFFGPLRGRVHGSFAGWDGADVILATGWQTVHRTLRLPRVASRAYLVQDHEPEFYGTSAEATWAAETYRLGLHCVCASPWLAALVKERYGATAGSFDLGVDHPTYRPSPIVQRRDDLVLLYARAVTPRRAVPLGVLAFEELHRRRPGLELALFGEARPLETRFPTRHLGIVEGPDLARLYAEATVGVVLSMTNPSLVPTEMLACGLPCVDLASDAMIATFGANGPVELVPFDPVGLADAIERLLDDPALRSARQASGLALTSERTWDRASAQVEAGLREALRTASLA